MTGGFGGQGGGQKGRFRLDFVRRGLLIPETRASGAGRGGRGGATIVLGSLCADFILRFLCARRRFRISLCSQGLAQPGRARLPKLKTMLGSSK